MWAGSLLLKTGKERSGWIANARALPRQETSRRVTPLVTVIIPTANRAQFLPRAVESALSAGPGGDVEVIVVPNGPDESWRQSLAKWRSHPSLEVVPVPIMHGNVARNAGLLRARGKYVRFLDDDDYLLPDCVRQVEELEKTHAEICSGVVGSVDVDGSTLGTLSAPDTMDFVCAAVSKTGFRLPVSNLYLSASIKAARWQETVNRAQDYVWMISLAAAREWHWIRVSETVGVWRQHPGVRTSTVQAHTDRPYPVISALTSLIEALGAARRLTEPRAQAISAALWEFAHWRFPYQPVYWHRVANRALAVTPGSRPDHPLFEKWPFRAMDPLAVEWMLLPARLVTNRARIWKRNHCGWDYRRRL